MHLDQGNEFGCQSTFLEMHRRDTRRRWEPPSLDATPKDVLDGPLLPLPLSPKSLYLRPFKSNWIAQGRRDIEEATRERELELPSLPWCDLHSSLRVAVAERGRHNGINC